MSRGIILTYINYMVINTAASQFMCVRGGKSGALKNQIKERKAWSRTGGFRLGEAFCYRRTNKAASVCRGSSLPGFKRRRCFRRWVQGTKSMQNPVNLMQKGAFASSFSDAERAGRRMSPLCFPSSSGYCRVFAGKSSHAFIWQRWMLRRETLW